MPLSLRRVPPNALVGDGAKNFAEEHGMETFNNEYLVSKNARDRFLRWQDDLKRAEAKARAAKIKRTPSQANMDVVSCQYDTPTPQETPKSFSRDHVAAIMAGTYNEGQPDSPYASTPASEASSGSGTPAKSTVPSYFRVLGSSAATVGRSPIKASPERLGPGSPGVAPTGKAREANTRRSRQHGKKGTAGKATDSAQSKPAGMDEIPEAHRDGSASPQRQNGQENAGTHTSDASHVNIGRLRGVKRPVNAADESDAAFSEVPKRPYRPAVDKEDFITDTIGAIAIDDRGQIAAGSSSGGIGMKHRGRLGPAALVGIGTAVVPCSEDDDEGTTVAAVTSGTGEHMATTMASQRCAERIFRGTRRGAGGLDIEEVDEDAIMESFIADDFMGHPGVKGCHSAGAIGVMVVKKCRGGYYLYFAHNTDSFALASMGGTDNKARCTMSRLPEGAKVAKGGRKIRID